MKPGAPFVLPTLEGSEDQSFASMAQNCNAQLALHGAELLLQPAMSFVIVSHQIADSFLSGWLVMRFRELRKRLRCAECGARPTIIEQSSELPTVTLPMPDEREWKQKLRRFR